MFATGTRRLGIPMEPGRFSVRIELQANLAAGSYAIEVFAQDNKTLAELVPPSSVMVRVTNPDNFWGWVQMNAVMSKVE